jgi:hypothetical protein
MMNQERRLPCDYGGDWGELGMKSTPIEFVLWPNQAR